MDFEWDQSKNEANQRKHGISFEEARLAFADPKRKIRLNAGHSRNEIRYYCLGMAGGRVLTVRFTVRRGRVRIIGAGFWREGRKAYEEG